MFARSFSISHAQGLSSLMLGGADLDNRFPSLALMATVNLHDVSNLFSEEWPEATLPFPGSGHLLFFYDLDNQPWGSEPFDRDSVKVIHSADSPNVSGGRPAKLTPMISQPSGDRMDDADGERYEGYLASLEGLQNPKGVRHQLFGYPIPIQGDDFEEDCMAMTKYAYSLESAHEDWVMLLQLDSDDDMDWMFGDSGTLYFFIRKDDLKKGDFTRVWFSLQCC